MLSKLLKKKPIVRAPDNPSTPDGTIIYAVGDIHGRLDLLVPLVEAIKVDASQSDARRKVCIFLGDYIDRGPDSRGVLQYLAALGDNPSLEWRFLRGNHEEAMLDFLEDPSFGSQWCEYGGDATLESYGLRIPTMRHKPELWAHLAADLDHKLTAQERRFLTELEFSISLGDYFFAHAGARPGAPLDQQSEDDLLWVRKTFLASEVEFEQVVVHGHTPEPEIYADRRRVGVDTKAYASGVLSALRLAGSLREALQTVAGDKGASVRRAPVASSIRSRAA
jgi:serine/threonine protein phosphatase 1